MNPAFSVVFLTTLLGAGQGLFLALFVVEGAVAAGLLSAPASGFYSCGSATAVILARCGTARLVFPPGSSRSCLARGGDVAHVLAVA